MRFEHDFFLLPFLKRNGFSCSFRRKRKARIVLRAAWLYCSPLCRFQKVIFFFFFNQLTFWDLLQSVSLPHFYQDLFFPLMLLIPSSILWTLLPAAFLTISLVLKGRLDFLVWLGQPGVAAVKMPWKHGEGVNAPSLIWNQANFHRKATFTSPQTGRSNVTHILMRIRVLVGDNGLV